MLRWTRVVSLALVSFTAVLTQREQAAWAATTDDDVVVIVDPNPAAIVGGVDAANNEFPFVSALFANGTTPGVGERSTCTGSLIHPYVILTAAHCLGLDAVGVGSWVYIGQTDLDGTPDGDKSARARVAQVISHPNYRAVDEGDDIALLVLNTPIGILPGRMETSNSLLPEAENHEMIATGYGQTTSEPGSAARILQKVTQPLYLTCECHQLMGWQFFKSNAVTTTQVCYYPPTTSRRVCQGDSGGPMLTGTTLADFRIRGVVAFGPGCVERNPDIYTRVSSYLGWIHTQISGGLVPSGALDSRGFNSAPYLGVTTAEWDTYPAPAQANRACIFRGWLGGFSVPTAPPGFNHGIICLHQEVAESVSFTVAELNAISTNWRLAGTQLCRARNHFAGVFVGEESGETRGFLCIRATKNAWAANPLTTDLNAISADPDMAGLGLARQTGFQFGLWSGVETATNREYFMMGSNTYTWRFEYGLLQDSSTPQTCANGCPTSCPHSLIRNGVCDSACNNALCAFDGGDCNTTPSPTHGDGAAPSSGPSNSTSSALSGGAIAGIVIGSVVGFVIIAFLAVWLLRGSGGKPPKAASSTTKPPAAASATAQAPTNGNPPAAQQGAVTIV